MYLNLGFRFRNCVSRLNLYDVSIIGIGFIWQVCCEGAACILRSRSLSSVPSTRFVDRVLSVRGFAEGAALVTPIVKFHIHEF